MHPSCLPRPLDVRLLREDESISRACPGKAPWRGLEPARGKDGCLYLPEALLSCRGSSPCVRSGRMTAPSVCSSLSVPGAAQSESTGSGSGVKGERGSPGSVNLRPDTRAKVWQPGKTARGCCHSGHARSTPPSIHPSLRPSFPPHAGGLAVDGCMGGQTDG